MGKRAERFDTNGEKVAGEVIDVPCWRSPLKVITGADSHGSLKILEVRLRILSRYLLIMRAPAHRV